MQKFNSSAIVIRSETKNDAAQVYRVNSSAFENEAEAKLVDKLREAKTYIGLVAELDGEIVGHISFSALTLDDAETHFLGLAPMSVLPEFQNKGIGSQLVKEGLKVAFNAGYSAVFVLGHANYYPRFGFETAGLRGFSCEYPVPDEHFMALELVSGALSGQKGVIRYGPEFSVF